MFPNASLQYDKQQNAVVNQSGTPYDIDRALDNGILIGKDRSGDKIAAVPESHPVFNMIQFHTIMYECLGKIESRDMLFDMMTKILNNLTHV
jgi:hypothetical protein